MARKNSRLTKKTMTAAEVDIYALYLKGTRIHSQPRKAPADYKQRTGVGIVPFGFSPDGTNDHVKTTMTRGALGILGVLGTINLDGIYGLKLDATNVAEAAAGFYPALCRITLIQTAAVAITAGTSAFTGRPRNYKPGRSGSVPFGRGTTTAQPDANGVAQTTIADIDYKDAVAGIRGSLGVAQTIFAGKIRASFEPELFRADRPQPQFGGAAVAPNF